jgi:hypothetical protein
MKAEPAAGKSPALVSFLAAEILPIFRVQRSGAAVLGEQVLLCICVTEG